MTNRNQTTSLTCNFPDLVDESVLQSCSSLFANWLGPTWKNINKWHVLDTMVNFV